MQTFNIAFALIWCTYSIAHQLQTNNGTRSKIISIIGKKKAGVDGPTFIWYLYNASKLTKSAIFNIIGKMNLFRSEHGGHKIMKINNWFEARQDDIEKNQREKQSTFNHSFPDLPHSSSV